MTCSEKVVLPGAYRARQPFFIVNEKQIAPLWGIHFEHLHYSSVGMLKKDLVDKVSSELSMQKQDVGLAVDIMLETMAQALVEERRIELRGFGSFSVRSRKPRSTKNPRTGKVMDIPDRKTLHFTMSKSLKEALISDTE
jgi:integration host factor subunit beta